MPPSNLAIPEERTRVSLPTLICLNQAVGGLHLPPPGVQAWQGGVYLSAFKGRGMEYDESRPYLPGDDVRSLDWRVTARTGKTHTKCFREERERPVFVSVDARGSMFFGTRRRFKVVQAAQLAALAAWSALRRSDRVGGQIFTESTSLELKPAHGRTAVLRFLHKLAELTAPTTTPNPGTGLDQALDRLARHARPGSLVLVLSDFRGLTSAGEASLRRLNRHCDVALLSILDPLERQLPERGRYRFGDGQRDLTLVASRDLAAEYARRQAEREDRLASFAQQCGMRYVACLTLDDPRTVLRTLGYRHRRAA